MNRAQLRAFHTVAERGGFSAAAREIGITQPALTVQVRTLERDFGVQLFHRINRGVQLTETGESLLALTRRYFAIESEAEAFLRSVGAFRTGQIRIAADAPYHVIPLLAEIRSAMPGVDVHVSFGNSDDVLRALDSYDAHLGISSSPRLDDRYEVMSRQDHPIILMVPKDHAWADMKSVALSKLDGAPLIVREAGSSTRQVFDQALGVAGVHPDIVLELGSREAVREAVAAHLGLGVVQAPEFGDDARLAAIPFAHNKPLAVERLICLKERADSPLMRQMIQLISSNRR